MHTEVFCMGYNVDVCKVSERKNNENKLELVWVIAKPH